MKQYDILFSDFDGTLIETISGELFPKGIWDMKLRFDVLDAIKKLHPQYVFIVTNQGGIDEGCVNQIHFNHKLDYICSSIKEYCNCHCDAVYCATNDKLHNTQHLNDNYSILMVGDASGKGVLFSHIDKKTAENYGIDYMDVDDFVNTYLEDEQ